MLIGLLGSFGSFIYNMSEYHVLSDNVPKVQLCFLFNFEKHILSFSILYKFQGCVSPTQVDALLFNSFSLQVYFPKSSNLFASFVLGIGGVCVGCFADVG